MIDLVWIALLAALGAWFISAPFRGASAGPVEDPEIAALEAARDAKYREIKDAEIDYRAGKLNKEDFDLVDRDLRREAVHILNQLERAYAGASPGPKSPGQPSS